MMEVVVVVVVLYGAYICGGNYSGKVVALALHKWSWW